MNFSKKTIKDINVKGKTVLVSVDFNVPGDEDGKVTDTYRMEGALPTIKYLLEQDCKIIIISHRGRPAGRAEKKYSLESVAEALSGMLNNVVQFVEDCIGPEADRAKKAAKPGQILLLENTRFHAEEEANNPAFAKQLAAGAQIFVQDAFGNAHRKHASTEGVTHYLPSVAGLLLVKEVEIIMEVIENPKRPLMAIIGGAKVADKIDTLNNFIEKADIVAVGGGMANTFLQAAGIETGSSLADPDDVPIAKKIIERARAKSLKQHFVFYLPQDGVVANKIEKTAQTRIVDWDTNVVADVENYPKRPSSSTRVVSDDELILDIGPFSGAFIAGCIQLANTVIWNGTMGVVETPALNGPVGPFAHGTDLLIEAITGQFGHKPFSVVGGGDTASYINQLKLSGSFNHVSTGGGACLELMAGKKLPAVEALEDK